MPILGLRAESQRGRAVAPVPRFGSACVCCNGATHGRVQHYQPSSERHYVTKDFEVPVCDGCRDHALLRAERAQLFGPGIVLGIVMTGLGAHYGAERGSMIAWEIMGLGIAVVVALVALLARAQVRMNREKARAGHHPWMLIRVAPRITEINTTNPELVDDLKARNPGMRSRDTPAERKRLPKARVVRDEPPARSPEEDAAVRAQVDLVVGHVTKNTAESLQAARELVVSGAVDVHVVEQQLAELQAVLGRSDLVARLHALSSRADPHPRAPA